MSELDPSTFLIVGVVFATTFPSCTGICIENFFAQPVIYDKAMDIDFYFTGINVPSVSACAEFCGTRRFCRTAVFNSHTKTCAISYEYTLNCRYNKNRFTDFDAHRSTSHLIQIACVTKCNDDFMEFTTATSRTGGIRQSKMLEEIEVVTDKPDGGSNNSSTHNKEVKKISGTRAETITTGTNEKVTNGLNVINSTENIAGEASRQVCFRAIQNRYLLGGLFEEHMVSSIDDCRCLCAATFSTSRLHRCQSLQWYPSGKCVLNKASHFGKFDLIEQQDVTYQFVSCDMQVLLTIFSKICNAGDSSKFPATSSDVPTAMWNFTTTAPTSSTRKITDLSPTEDLERTASGEEITEIIKTDKGTTTEMQQPFDGSDILTGFDNRIESSSTEVLQHGPSNSTVSSMSNISEYDAQNASLNIINNGCFEEISGYMMINVAAGLEHDVSMEECKCYCANSKISRRYSFECRSSTYYHEERDCVLNLDDRHRSPQLLEKQSGQHAITYLAPSCGKEETTASLMRNSFDSACKRVTQNSMSTSKARKMGANTDECFLELSDFVLEGTALAIETTVSVQKCKCKCIQGELIYGEACQSFQYYFDSNTCLINKQNRFSNPENLIYVPNSHPRSYFEHKCATKDAIRLNYVTDFCIDDSSELQENTVNVANRSEKGNEKPGLEAMVTTVAAASQPNDEGRDADDKNEKLSGMPVSEFMVFKKNERDPSKWNSSNETRGRGFSTARNQFQHKVDIPEAEMEEDNAVMEAPSTSTTTTTTTTTTQRAKLKRYVVRAYVNRNIPETDGLDEREFDKIVELELPDEFRGDPSEFLPPIDAEYVLIQWPSHLNGPRSTKFDSKMRNSGENIAVIGKTKATTTTTTTTVAVVATTATTAAVSTTAATTATTSKPATMSSTHVTSPSTLVYPTVGRCTYSAMYQTSFQGTKLIRTIYVKSPGDCFAACHAHSCRSANIISNGATNTCELFRDSIIDYRHLGMIIYDASTVYLDGIRCGDP